MQIQNKLQHTKLSAVKSLDEDSDFVKMYFGQNKSKPLDYFEFTQFIRDHFSEWKLQQFNHLAFNNTEGCITPIQFEELIKVSCLHLLSEPVKNNLATLAHSRPINYPFMKAVESTLANIELMKRIYLESTHGSTDKLITKEDFLSSALFVSEVTPFEADILFDLAALMRGNKDHYRGYLSFGDLQNICPKSEVIKPVEEPVRPSIYSKLLQSVHQ